MKTLAIQYLEYAPPNVKPAQVRERLQQACELLPINIVILGWDLPPELEEAVADESARQHATLYHWHPLLASDTGFVLPAGWQSINLRGEPVPGYKGLPEFTFLCPNRSDVQDWIAERIEAAAQRGMYQGLFFDRMRFPSPAEDLKRHLSCFCTHCQRIASDSGLDLESAQSRIDSLLTDAVSAPSFIRSLFAPSDDAVLESFFNFRCNSITRTIQYAAQLARSHSMNVGLDCFSPTLTRMVGQRLSGLDSACDWIKLMTYPRVFGPAGLPFELRALAEWLTVRHNLNEAEAVRVVNEASGLSFTKNGLQSEVIEREIQRGRDSGVTNLLAGIALVELEGIHNLSPEQIQLDVIACQGADGMVLSWDLWHIKPNTLKWISRHLG